MCKHTESKKPIRRGHHGRRESAPLPISRGADPQPLRVRAVMVPQGNAKELTDVPQFAIPSLCPPQIPNPVALKALPVQFGYWM